MMKKRVVSLLIAMLLFLNMTCQVAAETGVKIDLQNSGEDADIPVEEWVYTPQIETSETAPVLNSDGSEGTDSEEKMIEVHVKATKRGADKVTSVGGAEVHLYAGAGHKVTVFDEDGDGIVQVPLDSFTEEELRNATMSAHKVVERGRGINNTAKDALYNHFPHDTDDLDGDGDTGYYRYTLELHSEEVDPNGNWLGAPLPIGKKVDIAFIIDSTGSMGDEINNVKTNITAFAENLVNSGLQIRFCIIDYKDITRGEETNIHQVSGSHWLTDMNTVINEVSSIKATGGSNETPLDPLGYIANNSLMNWRSDAHRFAFLVTDEKYVTDNNYGYSSLAEVTAALKSLDINTSVVTSSDLKSTYSSLYTGTNGIYANIASTDFKAEMMTLSNRIVEVVANEMTLVLKEPRLLVNMSVCYFANDMITNSTAYRDNVKKVMNEYAHRLAESTDGHVMLDKVLLFSTSKRTNFYNLGDVAAMADIRIEAEVAEDGKGTNYVQVHSNAYTGGFFSGDTYTAVYDADDPENPNEPENEHFYYLKNGAKLNGKNTYYRIQLGGTSYETGFSINKNPVSYSKTVMHETGHYLLGFFDEYLDANKNNWNNGDDTRDEKESEWTKPYEEFGLMDVQWNDHELSKTDIDYSYMTSEFSEADISEHTRQSYLNHGSCEDSLAVLLTSPEFTNLAIAVDIKKTDYSLGDYVASYWKAESGDRTATYSYAGLDDSDYKDPGKLDDSTTWSTRSSEIGEETVKGFITTRDSVADINFTNKESSVIAAVNKEAGKTYTVYILRSGEENYTSFEMTDNTVELPVEKGELAEVIVEVFDEEKTECNRFYIDRSDETEDGFYYNSLENAVLAYVTTEDLSAYTFIADNRDYSNGDYYSVNQATNISSLNSEGFTSGEIYSVASYLNEIDYSTLSWFKYADGVWTQLATDYSTEENMNIGARADLNGEGLYVLMAKKAKIGTLVKPENLSYVQSTQRDAQVTLSFEDKNDNSKYYNVYYSDEAFTDKYSDNVFVQSFDASSTDLTLSLIERGKTVQAAVEIVAEDGSRSELAFIELIAGEADKDGDGIPDWYCDEYLLWGYGNETEPITDRDPDDDGLNNLVEYRLGSDPTDRDDPFVTSVIPAESVVASESEIALCTNGFVNVTATVLPESATDKTVKWSSSNTDIVQVEPDGIRCKITAVGLGDAYVYAVSSDGGYSAPIKITVTETVSGNCGDNISWSLNGEGVLSLSGKGAMPEYMESTEIPWRLYRESISSVKIDEGITSIENFAFYKCTNLQEISIPDSVAHIGQYAFCECSSLDSITFHGDAPVILEYAFKDLEITAYYPGDNETWTEDVLLDYGGTIEWKKESAFIATGWSGDTTWSLTEDGILTFSGKGNIKSYGYAGGQPWLNHDVEIKAVIIEDGITAIGTGAFKDMTSLETVTLPETGLTKIGEAAFYGCTSLKEITIPEGIYTLWSYTFKNCSSLTDVNLPKTLIKIDQGCFESCTALNYIYIPTNTEIIGSWSFKACSALREVDMQWADATKIREGAFKNCTALTIIYLPGDIQVLGDSCFYGIGAESFTVPDTVTSVEAWCFARASLTEIIFEGDAPAIGEGAFNKIKLTAYYPGGNETWTSGVMKNYGGTVSWEVR